MLRLNRISDQMNCVDFRMEKVKCGWNVSYKVSSNEGHSIGGRLSREGGIAKGRLSRVGGFAGREAFHGGRLCIEGGFAWGGF